MGNKASRTPQAERSSDKGKSPQSDNAKGKGKSPTPQPVVEDLDPVSAREFIMQTQFDHVEVSKLYNIFSALTANSPRKAFDRVLFKQGLAKLQEAGLKNLDQSPFADRLFTLLDANNDGVVDFHEFITGLSLLCKGSADEKLALCFRAYDLDNNGFISKDELAHMLKQAWVSGVKALNATTVHQELDMAELERFAEQTARNWADSAFENLDANGDGKLSFDEFKVFVMSQPKITATLEGFKKEVAVTL